MTVLALRTCRLRQRRQQAARRRVAADVAAASGPSCRVDEVPITSITNGVHTATLAQPRDARAASTATSARRWRERPEDPTVWKRVEQHPRRRAVARRTSAAASAWSPSLARGCAPQPRAGRCAWRATRGRRGARPGRADHRLRPPLRHLQARPTCSSATPSASRACSTTTSGRCSSSSPARPTRRPRRQGADRARSCSRRQRPRLRDRIVFLEDYDMNVARYLVQGVDVWLNTPRRPLEAAAPAA